MGARGKGQVVRLDSLTVLSSDRNVRTVVDSAPQRAKDRLRVGGFAPDPGGASWRNHKRASRDACASNDPPRPPTPSSPHPTTSLLAISMPATSIVPPYASRFKRLALSFPSENVLHLELKRFVFFHSPTQTPRFVLSRPSRRPPLGHP